MKVMSDDMPIQWVHLLLCFDSFREIQVGSLSFSARISIWLNCFSASFFIRCTTCWTARCLQMSLRQNKGWQVAIVGGLHSPCRQLLMFDAYCHDLSTHHISFNLPGCPHDNFMLQREPTQKGWGKFSWDMQVSSNATHIARDQTMEILQMYGEFEETSP